MTFSDDTLGNYLPSNTEARKYIMVKLKMKVKEEDGHYIYGEDQIIMLGKGVYLFTANFNFEGYVVGKIE